MVSRLSDAYQLPGSKKLDDVWRAAPNEVVDAAWENLSPHIIIRITESDVLAAGKDPAKVVALPPEYNIDGERTYLGKPFALHNLHCLNYIRKAMFSDYYSPNGTKPLHWTHVTHCFMTVLEALMCTPDTGVTSKWPV